MSKAFAPCRIQTPVSRVRQHFALDFFQNFCVARPYILGDSLLKGCTSVPWDLSWSVDDQDVSFQASNLESWREPVGEPKYLNQVLG
jgi:hypothetical protein